MGLIAIFLAVSDRLIEAALFVMLGIIFDFFDGLVARWLNVQSDFGIQLDSLADVVTSGVVPGIVMFQLFMRAQHQEWMDGLSCEVGNWFAFEETSAMSWKGLDMHFLPFIGLLLTLAAAYRLAKFNIDLRQKTSFIGLPTPAMAIFVLSLPLISEYHPSSFLSELLLNEYFLIIITIVLSLLMNANIELFSLKIKDFTIKNQAFQIVFILLAIILIALLKFVAVPFIIVIYIFFSLIKVLSKTN